MSALLHISRIAAPRPMWFDQAACRGHNPDWWHPLDQAQAWRAIHICRRCPVRQDCLDWADANDERLGIWGGLQPTERKANNRRRAVR